MLQGYLQDHIWFLLFCANKHIYDKLFKGIYHQKPFFSAFVRDKTSEEISWHKPALCWQNKKMVNTIENPVLKKLSLIFFGFATHEQHFSTSYILFPVISMSSFFKCWITRWIMPKYLPKGHYWSCVDLSLKCKNANAGAVDNLQEALAW